MNEDEGLLSPGSFLLHFYESKGASDCDAFSDIPPEGPGRRAAGEREGRSHGESDMREEWAAGRRTNEHSLISKFEHVFAACTDRSAAQHVFSPRRKFICSTRRATFGKMRRVSVLYSGPFKVKLKIAGYYLSISKEGEIFRSPSLLSPFSPRQLQGTIILSSSFQSQIRARNFSSFGGLRWVGSGWDGAKKLPRSRHRSQRWAWWGAKGESRNGCAKSSPAVIPAGGKALPSKKVPGEKANVIVARDKRNF